MYELGSVKSTTPYNYKNKTLYYSLLYSMTDITLTI